MTDLILLSEYELPCASKDIEPLCPGLTSGDLLEMILALEQLLLSADPKSFGGD